MCERKKKRKIDWRFSGTVGIVLLVVVSFMIMDILLFAESVK